MREKNNHTFASYGIGIKSPNTGPGIKYENTVIVMKRNTACTPYIIVKPPICAKELYLYVVSHPVSRSTL